MTDAQQKSYYITTPIYYVNDKPHLGHAYCTIACDVTARFKRLDGYDVHFLTGTDEHGLKVQQSAEKRGITPQENCDINSAKFRELWPVLNISNNDFIRTTEERHKIACRALWQKLVETGDIYLGKYAGWYAVRDEAYYNEDELTVTPDGKKMSPFGAECTWVEEETYFFRLSAWGDKLMDLYQTNSDFIAPESRRNEVISFVKGGLKDLAISRTAFNWGIPVPGADNHIMYVWMDALTNYISAIGYPDADDQRYKKYWPADLHMVGKDIIRFHTVYWPAFLMAAGLPVPKRVFAHGWWLVEGEKMSKSLGNTLSPYDLVDTYGVDQFRFIVLRAVPFGNDGNFVHDLYVNMINNDLANGLGNLAQRTLSFIAKNCGGVLPAPDTYTAEDLALLKKAQQDILQTVRQDMDRQRFDKALENIFTLVSDANIYIDAQAPWSLKKTDTKRMGTVLYVLVEVIRTAGILMQPFTPDAASKLLGQLGLDAEKCTFDTLGATGQIASGTNLPEPSGVFPRLDPATPMKNTLVGTGV